MRTNNARTVARKLRSFAKKHGIRIECVSKVDAEFESPFSRRLGIDRKHKVLVFTEKAPASMLIHELGHLLFDGPRGAMKEEWRWFGWEFQLACQIGVADQWRREQKDYIVSLRSYNAFGDLKRDQQNELLRERHRFAKKRGFLKLLPGRPSLAAIA